MDVILYNLSWMAFNLYLALLPVIFSIFLFKMPNKATKYLVGALWFLYLPNTIYIYSDLHHLLEQWTMVNIFEKGLLILEYSALEVLGLACFLFAFYPIEVILREMKFSEKARVYWIVGINFLIGFVMALGKIERINSWDLFTNIPFLISSTLHIFTSLDLIALSILFGIFANCFYFLFRGNIIQFYMRSKTTRL